MDVFKPTFDLSHGYRYLKIEEIMNLNPVEVKSLLGELVEAGVLKRSLEERYVVCPSCNSPNISSNYICPQCGSFALERKALIEHIPCGSIHLMNLEEVEGSVCPNCNRKFTKDNYRKTESWIECSKCEKRIHTLSIVYKCRECGAEFDFDDAYFYNAYSYQLSDAVKRDIQRGIFFSSFLREALTKVGYEIKVPGFLRGKSKVEHEFDFIVVNKEGRRIAVDLLFPEGGITVADIMNEHGKIFDVKVEFYLVVSPRPAEEVERLAKTYKLNLISADDPKEALSRLVKTLERIR